MDIASADCVGRYLCMAIVTPSSFLYQAEAHVAVPLILLLKTKKMVHIMGKVVSLL